MEQGYLWQELAQMEQVQMAEELLGFLANYPTGSEPERLTERLAWMGLEHLSQQQASMELGLTAMVVASCSIG